ncbi:hypothetical protein Lal_00028352 [Lupinus albus]|nr:hypothetical protein Lal_00028352 [Lupinus albus]
MSINVYYNHIKGLWKKLDNYRPIYPCRYEDNCTLFPIVKTYRENENVICFLREVRSQIMLMDPLLTINGVFSMLIQQERHMQLDIDEPHVVANISNEAYN